MPTYLCHGFRWQRRSIQVYVVVQDLDDVSPGWLIPARSSQCLLENFYSLFDFIPYRTLSSSPASHVLGGSGDAGLDSEDDSCVPISCNNNNNNRATAAAGQSEKRSRGLLKGNRRSRSQSQTQPPSPESARRKGESSTTGGSRPQQNSNNNYNNNSTDDVAAAKQEQKHQRRDEIQAQDWSAVKLLEEYDPSDLTSMSRPYAYVADYVVRVDLSTSLEEEMQRYEERTRSTGSNLPTAMATAADGDCDDNDDDNNIREERGVGGSRGRKQKNSATAAPAACELGWFERLHDQLQRDEPIRWYVVVNGDEARDWPDELDAQEEEEEEEEAEEGPVSAPLGGTVVRTRQPATREQHAHHAQYTLQQLVFEEIDRKHREQQQKQQREQQQGSSPTSPRSSKMPGKDPSPVAAAAAAAVAAVPPSSRLSRMKNKMSAEEVAVRPKTASGGKGTLRRFFGRSSKAAVDLPP